MIRSGAGNDGREQICTQNEDRDDQSDKKDVDKTEEHRDELLQERERTKDDKQQGQSVLRTRYKHSYKLQCKASRGR